MRSSPLLVVTLAMLAGACVDRARLSDRCDDGHPCVGNLVCVDERCTSVGVDTDSGPSRFDAGEPRSDGGPSPVDGGPPDGDAGTVPDAGTMLDAGDLDAGDPVDASFPLTGAVPTFDAGFGGDYDAGPQPGCAFTQVGDHYLCETEQDWQTARDICRAAGLDLAIINDATEAAALQSLIGEDVWVGLSMPLYAGAWLWVDGSPVTYSEFDQPTSDDDSCLRLQADEDDPWDEATCSRDEFFVCETRRPPPVLTASTCLQNPEGCPCPVQLHGGELYMACREPASRAVAALVCETFGMTNAPLDDEARAYLAAERALREGDLWLGADDPDGDGAYRDATGTLLSAGWASGEPMPGRCGVVTSDGGFVTTPCGDENGFVCRGPLGSVVPPPEPDCTQQGDYVVCTDPRSWWDARAVCFAAGLDLAIVDDQAEQDTLDTLLGAQTWLGASSTAQPGVFRAVNGAVLPFANWDVDEPSASRAQCARMRTDGTWWDTDCNSGYATVCEEPAPLAVPAEPGLCLTGACPCELRVLDRVLYTLCQPRLDQDDVAAACTALGMEPLATIVGDEAAWLQLQTVALGWGATWTGAVRDPGDGVLRFRDGSAPGEVPWAAGEPGGPDCTRMEGRYVMEWATSSCFSGSSYICTQPLPAESGCSDDDGDGFGSGCVLGADCAPANSLRNPWSLDICNNVNDDCTGGVDDDPRGCPCTSSTGSLYCDENLNWSDARARCQSWGQDLAVVSNAAELGTLAAQSALNTPWVGLSRPDGVSPFAWVDSSPVDASLWAATEPGNDDCARMTSDELALETDWCVFGNPYICE